MPASRTGIEVAFDRKKLLLYRKLTADEMLCMKVDFAANTLRGRLGDAKHLLMCLVSNPELVGSEKLAATK